MVRSVTTRWTWWGLLFQPETPHPKHCPEALNPKSYSETLNLKLYHSQDCRTLFRSEMGSFSPICIEVGHVTPGYLGTTVTRSLLGEIPLQGYLAHTKTSTPRTSTGP